MLKSFPVKASKQPVLWRQAIRQGKIRGRGGINFLLAPVFSHYFSFKHHQSALFDHLIIGSNPIISALLLKELYTQSLKVDRGLAVKIGLVLTDNEDYWGYHAMEKDENWQEVYVANQKITSFENLLKTQPFFFQDEKQHNLTIIEDNFSVMNCIYDAYIDGYVLHLKDKEVRQDFHSQRLPTVVHSENIIRQRMSAELLSYLNAMSAKTSAISTMRFSDKKTSCADNITPTHILLAKRVWLSSYPEGWLNIHSIEAQHRSDKQDYESTRYHHDLEKTAFASARHCANDFHGLEAQSIYDVAHTRISPDLLVKEKYHD